MKTIHRYLIYVRRLSLAVLLPLAASAQSAGHVRGQVSNDATKAYLQNAVVTATEANRSTTTDQQGNFELALPPGLASLSVYYPGLDARTIEVNILPGQTVVRDIPLTANIYKLETYTVAGEREGTAKAIAMQQLAPNVKNVVSSDSFGNVADGNIGEFLQQLPGVNAVYVGADVRAIQIRGISEQLNSVTMDGARMASAPSDGTSRTFEFEQVSLGLIETIELTKAPTPDMTADSIGGAVNLVTKSAFDRAQPQFFSYSIGGVYRPKYYTRAQEFVREPIDNIGPSLNFVYSNVYGKNRNIGVLLTFTYHSQPGGDTASLMLHENAVKPDRFIYNVQVPRPAGAPRTRLALGAKVDYKWSANTVISFNTLANWFHENNDTRIFSNLTSQSAANFRPGYTSTFQEVLPSAASQATTLTTTDDKFGRTVSFSPSVRHRFPGIEIDYGFTISNSITQWEIGPNNRKSVFGSPLGHSKGQVTASLANVGYTIDRTQSLQWPVVTQTAGPNWYDLANYRNLAILHNDRGARDAVGQAHFDFKKRFEDFAVPAFIKTGVQFREQRRKNWTLARDWVFVGPDGVANSGDENIAQFHDVTPQWTDSNAGYRMPPWLDSYRISEHLLGQPEQWAENYANTMVRYFGNRNRKGVEDLTSAYFMGNVKLGALSILAGARVEDTVVKTQGPRSHITAEETALRNAWAAANPGQAVTKTEAERRYAAQYATTDHRRGEYRKVFPGVHFKYEPFSGVVARLSYSTSIGRPNFNQIIPATTVDDLNSRISTANPDLRPQFSDNFDATVEYYFRPAGFISAGVFLKEISDFIFSRSSIVGSGADNGFDGNFVGYQLTTPANAGSGRYRGFELNYRQQFTFLPGFWRGLSAGVNYTKTESYGDFGAALASSLVANVVPNMVNFNLGYAYNKLDVRLVGTWRDEFLVASNASVALLTWQLPKTQLDIKVKYSMSPRLGFFFDVQNFNRAPIAERYQGPDGTGLTTARETRIVEAKFIGGITGRF